MNGILKKVLINIIVFLFLIVILEIIAFFSQYIWEVSATITTNNKIEEKIDNYQIYKEKFWGNIARYNKNTYDRVYFDTKEFRPASILENPQKNAIVLLGCSFTYGTLLDDDNTFSAILSRYTQRNVYNLGLEGASLKESLYIISAEDIRKTLIKEKDIDYFIFTYIDGHARRLNFNHRIHTPKFKQKGNELVYCKYNYITQSSFLINKFLHYMAFYDEKTLKHLLKLQELYIKELNRIIKMNYPDAKLVIFIYIDNDGVDWDSIRDAGIIVIDVKELLDVDLQNDEYRFPDTHPNEKAWQVIVPAIAKRLNL